LARCASLLVYSNPTLDLRLMRPHDGQEPALGDDFAANASEHFSLRSSRFSSLQRRPTPQLACAAAVGRMLSEKPSRPAARLPKRQVFSIVEDPLDDQDESLSPTVRDMCIIARLRPAGRPILLLIKRRDPGTSFRDIWLVFLVAALLGGHKYRRSGDRHG